MKKILLALLTAQLSILPLQAQNIMDLNGAYIAVLPDGTTVTGQHELDEVANVDYFISQGLSLIHI